LASILWQLLDAVAMAVLVAALLATFIILAWGLR